MKKLKKILWVFLAVLLIIIVGCGIFINSLKPSYKGKKELAKLTQEVRVYYDTYGIPHIYAKDESDAFRALGYVHAQDRLWQMELLRRIAKGGLSEVFGADLIATDKFFLALGIDDASAKTVAQLDKNSAEVKMATAYLDGINQFIKEGPTPVEFYLTGLKKKPFTLRDMYNTIGYMAFSFAMAHKTDPLLSTIKDKLGTAYLKDLEINADPSTTLIKNYKDFKTDSLENRITAMAMKSLTSLSIPLFEGSNSWVIAPKKTKNGKVIFANDPHIGFAVPCVWYEAYINTPTYEKYGYYLGGVAFPLLAHDRKLAYGLTMFENDDLDFYYEKENPSDRTKYKTKEGWMAYETSTKTIKVKDAKDSTFSYKKTKHGPILNDIADQIKGERPVAMSWIYTKVENKLMQALYGMSHAHNIKEFKKALPKIHAPGLNVMYGDADGNVAWWAAAKLYRMPDSTNTKFILDGSSGKQEPIRFLDFSENPQAVNPPWNYVYSANNQPDSIAGMFYPGYYLPENRAKRITTLLGPKDDWDQQAVRKMIVDAISSVNPSIVTDLAKLLDVTKLSPDQIKELDKLSSWKGNYPINSVEATIFHRWIYYFIKDTFEDELGEDLFKQMLATHFFKRMIVPMAAKEESVWWDNIGTKDTVETKQAIAQMSFDESWASLEKDFGGDRTAWEWGKVHTLEHQHPMGRVKALRSFFNIGPFPVEGTREVINNMAFPYDDSGLYKVSSGPSTRRIIDFSDVENSISILPTGQSGNPFSSHYKDQAAMYVHGKFRKMMMNKEEITNTSKSLLTFKPTEE